MSEALVGAVLNARFRLVRFLGEGGMGAVYEAVDGQRGARVAIKTMHPEFCESSRLVERFFAEASACQALNHPNIVRVHEAARAEDQTPYLVMELLEGIPLAAYMAPGQTIAPSQAVPIVREVLQALSHAHGRGIVHRDLKPANVMLVQDASGVSRVKVLDFGIAKIIDEAGGLGSKTKTGALLGTPGYMSPEQIRNSKAVDLRTDLFSVGVLLYEMLAGSLPFPATDPFARMTAVLLGDLVPIEQVRPEHAGWSAVLRRALAHDPGERFQSADEMATTLATVARGGSVPLLGASPPEVSSPGAPRLLAATAAFELSRPVRAREIPPAVSPTHPSESSDLEPLSTWTEAPVIDVVHPPRRGVAPWLVAVTAGVCLFIGFALGLLVGRP
jgi:serine/threonine-protein kinase